VEFPDLDLEGLWFSVADDPKGYGVAWSNLAYGYLKCATIDDWVTVQFAKNVATLQAGVACG